MISLTLDEDTAVLLGYEPIYLDGRIVGQTSSCTFGYRIGKPVGPGRSREPLRSGAR